MVQPCTSRTLPDFPLPNPGPGFNKTLFKKQAGILWAIIWWFGFSKYNIKIFFILITEFFSVPLNFVQSCMPYPSPCPASCFFFHFPIWNGDLDTRNTLISPPFFYNKGSADINDAGPQRWAENTEGWGVWWAVETATSTQFCLMSARWGCWPNGARSSKFLREARYLDFKYAISPN